jgi:hypothetical protein
MSSEPTQDYDECARLTFDTNIRVGLLKPFHHYEVLNKISPNTFRYPIIDPLRLVHPFRHIPERTYPFSHIGVILHSRYTEKAQGHLFSSKTRVDITTINQEMDDLREQTCTDSVPSNHFEYHPDARIVGHSDYDDLTDLFLRTDCATITCLGKEGYMTLYYKAKISVNDKKLVANLWNETQKRGISINDSENVYKTRLRRKMYEFVAWSANSQGTKHFAGTAFLQRCKESKFIIDIFSKCGIYTRIEKTEGKNIITHFSIQRKDSLDGALNDLSDDWFIKSSEPFVIYGISYQSNDNLSITAPWVTRDGEFIIHPQNHSQRKQVNFLEKLVEEAKEEQAQQS